MKRPILILLSGLALLLLLTACGGGEPTPTSAPTFTSATDAPTNTPAPPPPAASTPEPIPPTQTQAPAPTAIPQPSATLPPTQTPIPTVVILVQNDQGQPIAGANVLLTNPATNFSATFATTADGRAIFVGVDVATSTYRADVTAAGYQPASTEITVAQPTTEITITLESGVTGVTTTITNVRSGPGTTFDIVEEVAQGTTLAVIGIDTSGEWYQVISPSGAEGWVFGELLTIQGDLGTITDGVPAPPSATPGPTAVGGTAVSTATATVTGTPATATPGTVTPTSVPITGLPTRPAPVPFDAAAMRAKMNDLEFVLVQMGGLLDRVAQQGGGSSNCPEYLGYYSQVAAMPTYSDVTEEWTGVYTEFQRVIDLTLDSNEPTVVYCLDGAVGQLSQFNYNLARSGIHDSLSLLYALMVVADDLLTE